MMSDLPTVPVTLRVHLAYATVHAIEDEVAADILHIKGQAVDPSLRPEGRAGVDADVLVRPAHLNRFLAGLNTHGWQQVKPLRASGLVQHSANWYQGELGQMDVYVRVPGIQVAPAQAFEVLWQDRAVRQIAGRPCIVPGRAAQRLILLLHSARDLRGYAPEVRIAWDQATQPERDRVMALAKELRAELALAAATGRLEESLDRPEYGLWRLYVDGTITRAGFRKVAAEIRGRTGGDRACTPPGHRVRDPRACAPAPTAHLSLRQKEATCVRSDRIRGVLRRGGDALGVRVRR